MENARRKYVARKVRKSLKTDEYTNLPEEFEYPISQTEWRLPRATRAQQEFFMRWKSEYRQNTAPNPVSLNQSQKKKKKTIFGRSITADAALEISSQIPSVPIQNFQFTGALNKEVSNIPIHTSNSQEEPAFHYISQGDLKDDKKCCSAYVCGQRVSLYPWLPGRNQREGGPITDCFGISYYPNLAVAALADGSSWGHTASKAASQAVAGFLHQVISVKDNLSNTNTIPQALLQGIATAHNTIISSELPTSSHQIGTSTLLGGVLIRTNELGKWIFICASVGDCKAFHLCKKNKKSYRNNSNNNFKR